MFLVFSIFLLLFLGIGLLSAYRSQRTNAEYYLASRSIPPWMVGLSAVATNNSGYMFIGMVGYAYLAGLASIWLAVGFVLGDFLSSLIIHRRFRQAGEQCDAKSYAGVLSGWHGTNYKQLRFLIGIISLTFLLAYATAQLSSLNKTMQAMGEGEPWSVIGPYLGFLVLVIYCIWGGMRASIWTDIAQTAIMGASIIIVLSALFMQVGGVAAVEVWSTIPGFLSLSGEASLLGKWGFIIGALFALSWGVAGMSVVGQPHIMSRFLVLDRSDNYHKVRPWYYLFYILLFSCVIAVGMLARIYLPELIDADPELALPIAVMQLLPPLVAGIILAGVLSATMSTADSQIISCSAVLAHDLGIKNANRPAARKLATLISAVIVLILALSNEQSIFNLVIFAWGAMGSAFGPLLLIYVLGAKPTQRQAIAMVLTGLILAVGWRQAGLNEFVYEGLPAAIASLLAYLIWQGRRGLSWR